MPAAFLGIDTETTGLDSNVHQCIQIYLLLMDEQLNTLDELHVHAYPDEFAVIDAKAIEVNGYTKEQWDAQGAVTQDVMAKLVYEFISRCKRIKCIAHNVSFDVGFLRQIYERHLGNCSKSDVTANLVRWDSVVGYHHVDTIPITLFMDLAANAPLRRSYSLVNLTKDYKIPHEAAHSAKSDLLACIDLLKVHIETARGLLQPVALVKQGNANRDGSYSRIIKQRDDGEWYFGYGNHVDKMVKEVAKEKPSYIRYVLGFTDLDPKHREYLNLLLV